MNDEQKEKHSEICKILAENGATWKKFLYVDEHTPIEVTCKHNHNSLVDTRAILRGNVCPVCATRYAIEHKFYETVRNFGGKVHNAYQVSDKKVELECTAGHRWFSEPRVVILDTWCQVCRLKAVRGKTFGELEAVVKAKGGKVIKTGELLKDHSIIECQFGHRWQMPPYYVINGRWCTYCVHNSRTRAKDLFFAIIEKRNATLLSEYKTASKIVTVKCEKGHIWDTKPKSMLAAKSWCPICNISKGEELVEKTLKQMGISFQREVKFEITKGRKYDFHFVVNGRNYLLEYDGAQHFRFSEFFNKTEEDYIYRRNIDRIKTYAALDMGYMLIRIDYTSIKHVPFIIEEALKIGEETPLILSKEEMYSWLYEEIPSKLFKEECITNLLTGNL